MKTKPILMHGRSIRALFDGRKTQTRRVVKTQPGHHWEALPSYHGEWVNLGDGIWRFKHQISENPNPGYETYRCPYGKPGDLLYARECHSLLESSITGRAPSVWYWADGNIPPEGDYTRPRSSIHMPRWASRITLRLTDVRVERVQEISGPDCCAEGIRFGRLGDGPPVGGDQWRETRAAFARLWDDTNGAGAWERNDWVWVLDFRPIHANVDDMLANPAQYGIEG